MSTPFSLAVATKAAIIDAFTAEQGVGGKLSSVVSIGTTCFPETNAYPYIGVELVQRKESFYTNNQRLSICRWVANISVKDEDLLKNAVDALEVIIDDGEGNGIEPIIRAFSRNKLGGVIFRAELDTTTFMNSGDDKEAAATEFFAEALVVFATWQVINA